jgi:hypothetical protein
MRHAQTGLPAPPGLAVAVAMVTTLKMLALALLLAGGSFGAVLLARNSLPG